MYSVDFEVKSTESLICSTKSWEDTSLLAFGREDEERCVGKKCIVMEQACLGIGQYLLPVPSGDVRRNPLLKRRRRTVRISHGKSSILDGLSMYIEIDKERERASGCDIYMFPFFYSKSHAK